jgi:anti-sigma-K factor RskA
MTMLNKEAPERQDLEALLPWHAAGTLARRDCERVERALSGDRDLALQYDLVREELNETIHLNEMLGAPSSRCMEKLFAAIEAEGTKAPVRRSFDLGGRISEFLSGFAPRTLAWSASAAAVAIVAQAAVLTTVVMKEQTGPGYEVASYRGAAGDDSLADVRFASHATVGEITKFLDAHNAVMVGGPKRGNFYRIRLDAPGLSKVEVAKLVQRMQAETKIVEFIATTE